MKTKIHFRIASTMSMRLCALAVLMPLLTTGWTQENAGSLPARAIQIEGVSEYRLSNGCRVLIYPDASAQVLTVNMTVLVGSRHEGYGETGMAHLLEHMLFKGTPKHPNIKEELKHRGASDMNGTTWYDRTNFYETLPATSENLEWAIETEADRLGNCFIRGEDLFSEMTVVRSEFEMNENSPQQILVQRMSASAFEWHNYGKTVIGSQADIERVPVNNLRRFYQKYYRPDNVVLVITGNVQEAQALAFAQKHFGTLERPKAELEATYTQEPTQDGERIVFLRRTGGTPAVGLMYHIPAASHVDYAAVKTLAQVLGSQPNGVLYQEMVKSKRASQVSVDSMECYDPGVMMAIASHQNTEASETEMMQLASQISTLLENDIEKFLTTELLEQAKANLMKSYEDAILNSKSLAMVLSDWSAYGDWRLFFINRDRVEKVSIEDLKRVAGEFLRASNRTTGVYIPTEQPRRSNIPATPNVQNMVKDYASAKSAVSVEQDFQPKPKDIQKRAIVGKLDSGVAYTLIPKTSRGNVFHLQLTLDFGSPADFTTRDSISAAALLGSCMMLGTDRFSREHIDKLQTKYKAQIQISSEPGQLDVAIEGREEFQTETLELLHELLRKPLFPEDEFGVLKSSQLNQLAQMKNSPEVIAQLAMGRALSPVEKDDPQYVPTFPETLGELRKAQVRSVKNAYTLLSGSHGKLTMVGAFQKEKALAQLNATLADWNPDTKFVRIENKSFGIENQTLELKARDQASAVYLRGANVKANVQDADLEALTIAADILGGPSLDSRLAKGVRDEKGLSYQIGCQFEAGDFDSAGQFSIFAVMNPKNKDAVLAAVEEVCQQVIQSGFNEDEVRASINSYEKRIESNLSEDATLCFVVQRFQRRGVNLDFLAQRIDRFRTLTTEEVNAAARKLLALNNVKVIAGDFPETKPAQK